MSAANLGKSASTKGKNSLLSKKSHNIPDTKPDFQPHLPWGRRIRIMTSDNNCNDLWHKGNEHLFLLYEISRRVGPVYCVKFNWEHLTSMYTKQSSFDIFGLSVILPGASRPFLYPHQKDDLCLVIKKMEPHRQRIKQAFAPSTLALTCVGLVMFWVTLRFIKRRYTPLEALETFLFGSFVEYHRRIPNFLSLALSAFGVIMMTAFCSKMMSFMAVMKDPPQPQTLDEAEARLTKVYRDTSRALKFDGYSDSVQRLMLKSVPYNDVDDIVKEIATFTQSGLFHYESFYEVLKHSKKFIESMPPGANIYLVPQCLISPAFPVYLVAWRWPHRERFSALLQRAVEAGIIIKLERERFSFTVNAGWRGRLIPPTYGPEPFALEAVLEPFIVLGAGLALSVAAFVGELVVCRWRRWRQRCAARRSVQRHIGFTWRHFFGTRHNWLPSFRNTK